MRKVERRGRCRGVFLQQTESDMMRRGWIQAMLAAAAGQALNVSAAVPAAASKEVENLQKNWRLMLAQGVNPPAPTDKVKLSNDEWKKRLDKLQYNVLREEGTERAGTSALNNEKRA